ncbi:MAG: DUF1731 domain-containing protein [Bacteroidetes bacterium]|nr:DUF1731 domain-containing protein [Bacteroidota bacterium]
MAVVLLAGGTGLIGARLQDMLRERGHAVRVLTRKPQHPDQYAWDPARGFLQSDALDGVDVVINLAGAGIADKRWSAARKKELIDSRVQSAELLMRAMAGRSNRPKAYLSASAIGYYGNSGEAWMSEDTPPVDDSFMVACCRMWEAAANEAQGQEIRSANEAQGQEIRSANEAQGQEIRNANEAQGQEIRSANEAQGLRVLILRIGVVMARDGGALPELARPVRFGLGAYFGNGSAWYSWIHIEDVCRMFVWALENESVSGVFNAVAPAPARNRDLVKAIARAMRRWVILAPAPSFVLRLMLGEMSAVVLNSNRVSAAKALEAGFEFAHPELQEALDSIYR